MAKTRFKPENAAKPGRAAGKPPSYWNGLLSEPDLKPMKKPDPLSTVEKLPEDQLLSVISQIGDSNISSSPAADTLSRWMDDLGKLHPEDARRVVRSALKSPSGVIISKAYDNILLLPESERVDAIEKALAGHSISYTLQSFVKAFETVLGCPGSDKTRLIKAALNSSLDAAKAKGLENILLLPESERMDAIEKALAGPTLSASFMVSVLGAFDAVFARPETSKARLVKAALGSSFVAIRAKACESIPMLGESERAEAIEITLTCCDYDTGAKALGHIGLCSQTGKSMLIKTGLKSRDKRICEQSFGLIGGRPDEADLLMAALESSHELEMRAAERACSLPENEKLLAAASKCVAQAFNKDPKTRGDALRLIPKFPAKYRADMVEAVLSTRDLANSMPLIPEVLPLERRTKLWKSAGAVISWAIKIGERMPVHEAIKLAIKLPAEHSRDVFWHIANSTNPDAHRQMIAMLDILPAEKQAAYLVQAFESYSSRTRREAFERIFTLPEDKQIELLENALESSYEDVRIMAARGRCDIPQKAALVTTLIHDMDARVRIEAVLSRSVGDEARERAVLSALESEDQLIYFTALRSSKGLFSADKAERIPWRAAFKKTKSALDSSQYDVRMEAAEAIAAFDDRRKFRLTKRALRSKYLGVRQKAIEYTLADSNMKRQIRLANAALKSKYGDNVLKIAFELLADKESTISSIKSSKLRSLAEKRLEESMQNAIPGLSSFGRNNLMDDFVIAHAIDWPFPEIFFPDLAGCAFRSGPKGRLELARKSTHNAGGGSAFWYEEGLKTVLHYERYWADGVEIIPSFFTSKESRERFWAIAAANAGNALCSGIKPKKAGMLLKTFPKEHWPALIALNKKVQHGPAAFYIAELAMELPEKCDKDTLSWAASQISLGLDSSDAEMRKRAILSFPAAGKIQQFGAIAWTTAMEKTKAMICSDESGDAIEASKRIGMFPQERQPELIEAALQSKWWNSILDGIDALAKHPNLRDERLWSKALDWTMRSRGCTTETIRMHAVEIASSFPAERYLASLAMASALPDKTHLGNLIRKRLESDRTIPPAMISRIADLPEGQRAGMYDLAVKSITARLGSNDHGIVSNASDCIGSFPPSLQVGLIISTRRFAT